MGYQGTKRNMFNVVKRRKEKKIIGKDMHPAVIMSPLATREAVKQAKIDSIFLAPQYAVTTH